MVNKKRIIVTGHNGYIGAHLVRLLKEEGYYVIGIDTNYFDDDCNFYPSHKPDEEIIKDIRNIKTEDLNNTYSICHLAALSNDPMGEINEARTNEINYVASVQIARLAKSIGVKKFIFSSSCSMYGITDGQIALNESANFAPVTSYAKSKVQTEKDVMLLGDKNFSVTFLRNATAYGLSPKLRLDLVVNNLVGWAVTTGKIKILSDGTPWRPLIHAEDIARAFIAVIKAPEERVNKQAFNVGLNSENYQIKEIAKLVKEVVPGCDVEITGEHGSDSRSYKIDFSKIEMTLPEFKPKWKLKEGIEELYRGYKNIGLNKEKFNGRYFIRIKQLKHLMSKGLVNDHLYKTHEI